MADALGIQGIAGVAKQTAFQTVIDATDKVPFISESIEIENQDLMHEYLYGGAAVRDMQRVFEPVGGTLESVIPYTIKSGAKFVSASQLIAHAMGTTVWDAGNTANQITFQTNLARFLTIAIDKGMNAADVWEFIGMMVTGFEISGEAGELIMLKTDVQGQQLDITTTENTVTELAALPDDLAVLLTYQHLVLRIGDQAGVLGAGDNYGTSSFSLTVDNVLTDPEQTSPDQSNILGYNHSATKQPIQMVRNGFRTSKFEFTLPRYNADTFHNWNSNETSLQATLTFTDPGGSDYFSIFLPHIKINKVSTPVAGQEAVTQTVSCTLLKRNTASDLVFANASTDNGEVWIETSDGRTASIL